MSKIIDALKAMIANPTAITDVTHGETGELFFLFNGKHKWSMSSRDGNYWVYYYPGDTPLHALASIDNWDEHDDYIFYSSKKMGPDAERVMAALFETVNDRRHNVDMDAVLDDIIQTQRKKSP